MLPTLVVLVFAFGMIFAILSDVTTMTIANRVTFGLAAAFAVLAPLTGMAWADFGWHLAAGALTLAVTFTLFSLRAMGGGDAKLIAATALWFGWNAELLVYLLYASVIGGVFTLLLMAFRATPVAARAGTVPGLAMIADRQKGVPYGVALGLAALVVFPATPLGHYALGR